MEQEGIIKMRLICNAMNCTANENGECSLDSITIDEYASCEDYEDEEG